MHMSTGAYDVFHRNKCAEMVYNLWQLWFFYHYISHSEV